LALYTMDEEGPFCEKGLNDCDKGSYYAEKS